MHSELVKIILAYAETTVFTALVTCLSLVNSLRRKLRLPPLGNRLTPK